MPRWLLWHLFVWSVRVSVLLASCLSMRHIVQDVLGYRMDLQVMLIVSALVIVTVRLWMPWTSG